MGPTRLANQILKEPFESRIAMTQVLWVKLHPHLPGIRPFHALQQSVVRPSHSLEKRRYGIYRLVVQRVYPGRSGA